MLVKTPAEQPLSGLKRFRLIEDEPVIKPDEKPAGGRRYQNLEQWHVKWSPDGDECWVDIKRDAIQS